MTHSPKTPVSAGVRVSNTILDTALGAPESSATLPLPELKADLKQAGIDLESSWRNAQQIAGLAQKRASLGHARRERLRFEASQSAGSEQRLPESRESLIEQIRKMILFQPGTAVYARKWEEGSDNDLLSLRDALIDTTARESARKQASG